MTDENTALNSPEVEMRVMLRMNNDFINYMLQKHSDKFKDWSDLGELESIE